MKYEDVEKLSADEVRITIQEIRHDAYTSNGRKQYLPDYSDPREYMALMEEIWEKKPDAIICNAKGNYEPGSPQQENSNGFSVEWDYFGDWFDRSFGCDDLWEAIARAWLVVCGGSNEQN